jgi:hypothetical protein
MLYIQIIIDFSQLIIAIRPDFVNYSVIASTNTAVPVAEIATTPA